MSESKHPILAREGWVHIGITVGAAVAVHVLVGWVWALPLWVAVLFVMQFFRDPSRPIPSGPGVVVCPADGRVIAVDEVEDPYLKRRAKRVSIFMNVFNVHSNRSPVGGDVKELWYTPGKFINASFDKASAENERNALWIKTGDGDDVVVVQVAGLIARRILCYARPGDALARGERYGFIRFGSRVDVYLPPVSDVRLSLGDKVSAGSDILGVLK